MAARTGLGNAEERWALLIEALQFEPDDTACQACLERLDDYVAVQLAGQDYTAHFPDVAVHLDACLDCAGAYARLYELELAEAAGRLPEPEHLPEPDLSFLLPGAKGPLSPVALKARLKATALAERLRAALRRTAGPPWTRLTLQLSADLLPLLRPEFIEGLRPSPALVPVRAPADTKRYAEVLLTLEPDETLRPDLPVALTAYRDAHRPEECLVEAIVEPPGRSWPDLEGTTVALIVAGERREAVTDAWGLAAFEGIPVARLSDMVLEITLPG